MPLLTKLFLDHDRRSRGCPAGSRAAVISMKTITYFDISSIHLSSFFLRGFMENAAERDYRLDVSRSAPEIPALQKLAAEWLEEVRVPLSIFRYTGPDGEFLFCIDSGDRSYGFDVDPPGYVLPLLKHCRYYFKVNYRQEVVDKDPILQSYASKIKPIPHSSAVSLPRPWLFLPKLNSNGGPAWNRRLVKRRMRRLFEFPSFDYHRKLRQTSQDIDVHYISLFRSGPLHDQQMEYRLAVIDRLLQLSQYNIVTGFASWEDELPSRYARYHVARLGYKDFVKELSRSKIGVYVRGTHQCLSGKFSDLMAIGRPIVGATLYNNTENMYLYDAFDRQFAYDDPDAMVERIEKLLENPHEREELARLNTATFENYLTPQRVVATILEHLEQNA